MREVTVVTVSKELTNGLITTLKSVQMQTTQVSHVVVDGSESARLSEYISRNFPNVLVLGQKPNGIYSAMNYGLSMVPDDANIIFLNSNDFLLGTNQLNELNVHACRSKTWGYGGVISFWPQNNFIENLGIHPFSEKKFERGDFLIPHPATLIQASWIKKLGGFNESLSIVADLEMAFRIYRKFGPPTHFTGLVSAHELGGVSTSNLRLQTRELRKARLINFPSSSILSMSKKIFAGSKVKKTQDENAQAGFKGDLPHADSCQKHANFPNCCRLKYLENVLN